MKRFTLLKFRKYDFFFFFFFFWVRGGGVGGGGGVGLCDHWIHLRTLFTLRKHSYLNIRKILPPKNENFQIINSDIFHNSTQNIDCGYSLEPPQRGGSNEYPQSIFLSRNKKNNVYPCKPQFYYIKMGFKGSKLYRRVFVMYIRRSLMRPYLPKLVWQGFTYDANGDQFNSRSYSIFWRKNI